MVAGIILTLWLAQASLSSENSRLLDNAFRLIKERQFDAAIKELNKAAGLEPRSAPVHLLLGQAYMAKGAAEFTAEAKSEFQQARELDPNLVLASFYIAKIDLDLGRVRQAEAELMRALEKKPGEHYLLALLGETRRQQGKAEEAIRLTTNALEAGQDAAAVHYFRALAWWDLRDEARALTDLGRILGSPHATVEAYLLAGSIHLHFSRLKEAEDNFRSAIQLGADRAEPRLRLAHVLRRLKQYDLALKELAQVESAPQLSSPYFQRLLADAACEKGLILSDQGYAASAKKWFQRALEIDPSHAEAASRLRP